MDTLRIYFDTNLVQFGSYMLTDSTFDNIYMDPPSKRFLSTIGQKDKLREDFKALRFILDEDDQIPPIFTTSDLTRKELSKIRNISKKKRALEFYDSLINYGNPNRWPSPINVPARHSKDVFEKIDSILRQNPRHNKNDTRHIYNSLIKKCNIFLTSDWKTILHYQKALGRFGVNAKSPHQLVLTIYGKEIWERGAGLLLRRATLGQSNLFPVGGIFADL